MAVAVAHPKYDTVQPRFIAGLVDGLVLMPIGVTDLLIYPRQIVWLSIVWTVVSYTAYCLYGVIGHARYGQTVGKHVMKIIVLDHKTETRISWGQALVRDIFIIVVNAFGIVMNIYLVAWGVTELSPTLEVLSVVLGYGAIFWFITEVVTALMNDKRRALHDLIAGTVVTTLSDESADGRTAAS